MDRCIEERPKLLIWSKNTYKQKKKPELEGEGIKAGNTKKNERRRE
jgi:hypothetical protein